MAHYKNWKIDEAEDLPLAVIEDTEDGYGICELEAGVDRMTNAKLIAAAPDLLIALEMVLEEWYPRLNGCADPNCLICAEHKKQKEQVEIAINRVITD